MSLHFLTAFRLQCSEWQSSINHIIFLALSGTRCTAFFFCFLFCFHLVRVLFIAILIALYKWLGVKWKMICVFVYLHFLFVSFPFTKGYFFGWSRISCHCTATGTRQNSFLIKIEFIDLICIQLKFVIFGQKQKYLVLHRFLMVGFVQTSKYRFSYRNLLSFTNIKFATRAHISLTKLSSIQAGIKRFDSYIRLWKKRKILNEIN